MKSKKSILLLVSAGIFGGMQSVFAVPGVVINGNDNNRYCSPQNSNIVYACGANGVTNTNPQTGSQTTCQADGSCTVVINGLSSSGTVVIRSLKTVR